MKNLKFQAWTSIGKIVIYLFVLMYATFKGHYAGLIYFILGVMGWQSITLELQLLSIEKDISRLQNGKTKKKI